MPRIVSLILASIFSLILANHAVADALKIIPDVETYILEPHLQILEDPSGSLSIDDVRRPQYDKRFTPLAAHSNFGVTRSVVWLKAQVIFTEPITSNWLLQFKYAPLESLTLFARDQTGHQIQQRTGNLVPIEERPLQDHHFLFDLDLNQFKSPHSPIDIYIKIETQGPIIINGTLMTLHEKRHEQRYENRVLGIIYGILIAMILYNLFICISVKDRRYFYYVLYITAATWGLSAHDGSFQEFFAGYSLEFSHDSIYYSVCSAVFFGALFIRQFLELKRYAPKVERLLYYLQISAFIFTPLGLVLENYEMTFIATFVSWAFCLLAIISGVISTRVNARIGRYFLLAWSALIFGIFLTGLRYLGIIPASDISNYFVHFGEVFEVILLSFALADRINQVKEEKDQIQKEANERLLENNKLLEKSNLQQRNFLTAVSHELRTPMNGIVGATDLLTEARTDEDKLNYVNDIYRCSRKMMAMVENVLDFTEAESGDFKPFIKEFSLAEMLNEQLIQFKGKAHRKGINFQFHHEPNDEQFLWRLYKSDPRIIQKILHQLLSNALKFTHSGGIDVTIKCTPSDKANFDVLSFAVCDTGIGIKPEISEEIFTAFQQGDGSFSREHEGLGIGLSVARALTHKIDGHLELKSTPGKGSCFVLKITLENTQKVCDQPPPQIKTLQAIEETTPPNQNKQILLVEDNPVNLKVLNKMVEKQGYSTLQAENGEKAVELLQDYLVDLILMDCQMPVMDGFEATKKIRQLDNHNKHVPIVAVTANAMSEDEALCYEAGMNGFVPKPINQKVVQSLLEKWVVK